MTSDHLIIDAPREGVVVIRLNRPAKLNALSCDFMDELTGALRGLATSATTRSVVITGEGRAFCAGGDLDDLYPRLSGAGVNAARLYMRGFHQVIESVRELPAPVVAAVNGACAGAGISLALACDLVVASESAAFHPSFTRAGLVPDLGALHFWPKLLGPHRAKELAFLAKPMSAADALHAGLINRVVPEGTSLEAAVELAAELAGGPAAALQMIKSVINASDEAALDGVLRLESFAQAMAFYTGEVDEGVAAFHERRAPRFTGAPAEAV
ncbi:enoyl-CoA hydratase/isomerase family protein [Sphaerisporangium sp. NPDC088356]|uniref:enoyl-CoA hydratase/isomerase family protein n=1 Tax=Sphaerisporangium sp. NPDC088356 TaxID=3154871 RepID=UPI003437AC73